MTVQEAIEYINAHTWSQWKLGLSRTEELLALLGDPQKHLRFVHVAGSNGKGSTCAMLERILREAGYVTGLYPSPYIEDFRERIQVCGELIPEEALARITGRVRDLADTMEDHPTQFELITAIGMVWFAENHCDLVVLEVGLGGIFDSTNVIDAPETAVITNIGFDHTEYLGTTLAEIAANKCGIIKTGSDVVCYENEPEVMEVVRRACKDKGCPLHIARFSRVELLERSLDGQTFRFRPEEAEAEAQWTFPGEEPGEQEFSPLLPSEKKKKEDVCGNREAETYRLALPGEYQLHNAAVALTVVEALRGRGFVIPREAVRRGLANVTWPARFEVLSRNPLFILDGGHNPQCAEALVQSLNVYLPGRKIVFLMGMLRDKEYNRVIDLLLPYAAGFVCLTPDSPRALPAAALADLLSDRGREALPCETPQKAIRAAFGMAAAGACRQEPASGPTPAGENSHWQEPACTPPPTRENSPAVPPRSLQDPQPGMSLPVIAFGSLYMAGSIRHVFADTLRAFLRESDACGRLSDQSAGYGEAKGETREPKPAAGAEGAEPQPVSGTEGAEPQPVAGAEDPEPRPSGGAAGTGPQETVRTCKKNQRKDALAARRRLTPEERAQKSALICKTLSDLPQLQRARTIFSYAAAPDEADPGELNRALAADGRTVCYPLCEAGGRMTALSPREGDPDAWRPGVFGIPEPVPERSVSVDPGSIDAVIVPCVAFDRHGARCGHGAGYYDRFLARLSPDVPKILIAFDVQEIKVLAVEETDVPMDLVVTESGVISGA